MYSPNIIIHHRSEDGHDDNDDTHNNNLENVRKCKQMVIFFLPDDGGVDNYFGGAVTLQRADSGIYHQVWQLFHPVHSLLPDPELGFDKVGTSWHQLHPFLVLQMLLWNFALAMWDAQ